MKPAWIRIIGLVMAILLALGAIVTPLLSLL